MTQPSLFDPPVGLYNGTPGHAKGSETSKTAARGIDDLNERQAKVLAVIRERPRTVFEIMAALGVPMHRKDSIAPRVSELKRAGRVKDSGVRRPTPHGSMATVWRAV